MTPEPDNAARNRKNWALFGVLVGFAAIMFVITIIRFAGAGTPN